MDLTNRREIARIVAHATDAATDEEIGEALSHFLILEVAGELDDEDLVCRAMLVQERLARAECPTPKARPPS